MNDDIKTRLENLSNIRIINNDDWMQSLKAMVSEADLVNWSPGGISNYLGEIPKKFRITGTSVGENQPRFDEAVTNNANLDDHNVKTTHSGPEPRQIFSTLPH